MTPKIIAAAFLLLTAAGTFAAVRFSKNPAVGSPRQRNKSGRGRRQGGAESVRQAAPGEVEIYVGNLNFETTESQLRAEFAKFGVVSGARVATNRGTGRSKGFGFVTMPHRKEAEIAIKALDNAEVMGRRLHVNEARGATLKNQK